MEGFFYYSLFTVLYFSSGSLDNKGDLQAKGLRTVRGKLPVKYSNFLLNRES